MHAILRIIRELSVNAIRHGKAKSIRIAGFIDGNQLLFSVQDDGTGFDADDAPGAEQGHFGLDGIRERLRHFCGNLDISSSPERGTKATVTIRIPHAEHEKGTVND